MSAATTRMTFGTVLGTVKDAATTVSTVFQTTTLAVGMAHTYVEDASIKQRLQSVAERDSFAEDIAITLAMKETLRKKEVRDFARDNQDSVEDYQQSYSRLKEKLSKISY